MSNKHPVFIRTRGVFVWTESITEYLKATNQMKWMQKMNNIRECVAEIINEKLIQT